MAGVVETFRFSIPQSKPIYVYTKSTHSVFEYQKSSYMVLQMHYLIGMVSIQNNKKVIAMELF